MNTIISAEKTKCMTKSKEPHKFKLELDGQIIQQQQKEIHILEQT